MLQTKGGVVSKSLSFECDAGCTDSAAPVAILLAFLDLEVTRFAVNCDDPFLFEIFLVYVVLPKGRRGDLRIDNHPLLDVCDGVDSK